MSSALEKGERIEIRGFGSLSIRQIKPKCGHNPKTGVIDYFKLGLGMRNRANNTKHRITDT